MATQGRDENGRFDEKVGEQDILKAFDFEATADDPYLSVAEVTAALTEHWGIDVTEEAVRVRVNGMCDDDLIARREFGPGVAYRALVGPELAPDVEAELAENDDTKEDATPIDDLELGDTE